MICTPDRGQHGEAVGATAQGVNPALKNPTSFQGTATNHSGSL
jgi:hypothetical protein